MTYTTKTLGQIAMNAFSEGYTRARTEAEALAEAGDVSALIKPIEEWTLIGHEAAAQAVRRAVIEEAAEAARDEIGMKWL